VRLACYETSHGNNSNSNANNNMSKALSVVKDTGSASAAYHLARQYEGNGQIQVCIHNSVNNIPLYYDIKQHAEYAVAHAMRSSMLIQLHLLNRGNKLISSLCIERIMY
jgi:hypothetical protein